MAVEEKCTETATILPDTTSLFSEGYLARKLPPSTFAQNNAAKDYDIVV